MSGTVYWLWNKYVLLVVPVVVAVVVTCTNRSLGPNFRNFLGRSLEDFFSKESMRIF